MLLIIEEISIQNEYLKQPVHQDFSSRDHPNKHLIRVLNGAVKISLLHWSLNTAFYFVINIFRSSLFKNLLFVRSHI